MKSNMTILAIDAGKNGAIAIMRGDEILTVCMSEGEDVITETLRTYANNPNAVAYLEKVGGYIPDTDGNGQPGSRMFVFGDNYGFWRGLLKAFQIKTVFVLPQMWQKGIANRKGSYGDRKRVLKEHAQRLFPNAKVTKDNADALGILHYARFQELGANPGYVANEHKSGTGVNLLFSRMGGKQGVNAIQVAADKLAVSQTEQIAALPLKEQMQRFQVWVKGCGYPVPKQATTEWADAFNWWLNKALNGEL